MGFKDADDYHSAANVEKMRSGIPLTDADRDPWLSTLRALIGDWIKAGKNAVLACSALKRGYRAHLRVGPESEIRLSQGRERGPAQRLKARHGHYMTESMLASQLETLEEPEHATVIEAGATPEEIVDGIRTQLGVTAKSDPHNPKYLPIFNLF